MGVIESIFFLVGRWFGYVGACMLTPDATCRPFLAFIALGAAASAALTLVIIAYRTATRRGATTVAELAAQPDPAQNVQPFERGPRGIPDRRRTPRPALQTHLHAA